jgi:hypothetical protein
MDSIISKMFEEPKHGFRGRFFVHFIHGNIPDPDKIPPHPEKKCLGKFKFSAEKVSKNSFPEKFRGI